MNKLVTVIAAAGLAAASGSASAWWGPGWDDSYGHGPYYGHAPHGYGSYGVAPPPVPHAVPGRNDSQVRTQPQAFVPPQFDPSDRFQELEAQREALRAEIDERHQAAQKAMQARRQEMLDSREQRSEELHKALQERYQALHKAREERQQEMHQYHEELLQSRNALWQTPTGVSR
jgi:hypothetical protein